MIDKNEISSLGVGIKISVKDFVSNKPKVSELLAAGRENQINLFDIVNVLGIARTENRIGKAIKQLDCRQEVFIITKGGIDWQSKDGFRPAGNPETIRQNIEKSLQKLQLDTIDCFQVYWPDKSVPLDETIGQLDRLKEEGLIRYTGVANFSLPQLKTALRGGKIDFIQFPYNLYRREAGSRLFDFCRQHQIQTIGYEGLCHGFFTDEFLAGKLDLENTFQGPTDYINDNYMLFKAVTEKVADYINQEDINDSFTSTMIKWGLVQEGLDHLVIVAYEPEHVQKIAGAREVSLETGQAEKITALVRDELEKKLGEQALGKIFPDYSPDGEI